MQATILETFHATLHSCLDSVMKNMLGKKVGDGVYELLEKKGIQQSEIASRFEEAVLALNEMFGTSARVLLYKTVVELYGEYFARPLFGFYDSLSDQVRLLRERVTSDKLIPRHTLTIDPTSVPP